MENSEIPKLPEKDKQENIKNPSINFRTQEQLVAFAKKRVREVFPERSYRYMETGNNAGKNYCYFPLSHYFDQEKPLINPAMMAGLQEGGTLMSVGAGTAYLEEFLEKGFSLPKESITLADFNLTSEAKQTDMNKVQFDMTKPWPEFKDKFKYIIFPESFGVAYLDKSASPYIQHPSSSIRSVREKAKAGSLDEISESDKETFINIAEADIARIKDKYNTIREALDQLDSSGEIRLLGHSLSEDELDYISLMLNSEYGDSIKITNGPILIIKKIEKQSS